MCSAQKAICFSGVPPFSFRSTSTLQTHPRPFSRPVLLSFLQHLSAHCPPLKKSKPMQTCSCSLFNSLLPVGQVLLFLELFLTGFGAVSKGASVFPLKEAWCSLLAACDNGPHMVVLQRLTKTWGLSAWAQAPGSASSPFYRPKKHSSSQSFVWALSLSRALCPPIWGPGDQRPLPQLCSLHVQYATNKYSRNAMNASLSVNMNVPN